MFSPQTANTTTKGNHTPSVFTQQNRSDSFIQPKLKVGKPGDKYEVEADQVADQVVNKQQTAIPTAKTSTIGVQTQSDEETVQEKPIAERIQPMVHLSEASPVQRMEEEEAQTKAADEEAQMQEEEEAQMQSDEEAQMQEEEEAQMQEEEEAQMQEEEEAQMQSEEEAQMQEEEEAQARETPGSAGLTPTASISRSIRSARGQGSPLPSGVKTQMESGFGADFSGVRVHTSSTSVGMNKALGAQAFTSGNDIHFNTNKFNPATTEGQTLLAHELTHTIQQGASEPSSQEGTTSSSAAASSGLGNTPGLSASEASPSTGASAPEAVAEMEAAATIEQGTEGGAEAGTAAQEHTTPRSPEEDPNFQQLEGRVATTSEEQQAHQPATSAAGGAQAAAPVAANEQTGGAQAAQVDTMEEQEAGEFSAEAFKAQLMQRIESMQLPKDEDEADDFENNNNIDEVTEQGTQDAAAERDHAAGAIASTTSAEPNTAAVPEREVTPLAPEQAGAVPASVNANQAMPPSRGNAEVTQPLQENMGEVDQQMADNEITDEQLANSNEPQFTSALGEKQKAEEHTQNAPNQFRQQEQGILSNAQVTAENQGQQTLGGMHADRTNLLTQVEGNQQQTGTTDSAERQRIATEINTIYETTKTDVETILSDLDTKVSALFKAGAYIAKLAFENYIDRKMDTYREERYGGVSGFFRRIGDVFTGLPDEVNQFFVEGRQVFIDKMDRVITVIANLVATKLTEAKNRITQGKQQVQEYVTALPQNLQNIGKEAAEGIQSKFDELEQSVNDKQDELIDSLADQYNQSLQEVDARIEEMKAANRGLIDMVMDAIARVIQTIINIKNMLTDLLSSAIDAITTIIMDPIGFLGLLIEGVGQGLNNFVNNILSHMQEGLIGWLTGSLGSVGITIPDNLFSLSGIFNLVAQILGISWDFVRSIAVKLLGEPVVRVVETAMEIFTILRNDGLAGLWEYIKEQFQNLKEMVMDAIRDMIITKVVEAGIKWILGLLNPAGAFIKAAMLIIDIVKFFIQRGSQIMEMVRAFIDGVKAVASGNVSAVANAIENALKKSIPVLIGFLASLLGISGLTQKVQDIIKKVREKIENAVTNVIQRIKNAAKRLFRRITGRNRDEENQIDDGQPGDGEVGEVVPFGEGHTLWVNVQGNNITIMSASMRAPVVSRIDEWTRQANQMEDVDKKSQLLGLLSQATSRLTDTERHALNTVREMNDGTPDEVRINQEDNETESSQLTLAQILEQIYNLLDSEEEGRLTQIPIDFGTPPRTHNRAEYFSQLKGQEQGINRMNVHDWLSNRDRYSREGRLAAGSRAQSEYRATVIEVLVDLRMEQDENITPSQARDWAQNYMNTQAALHDPDQVAGGDPLGIAQGNHDSIAGLGSKRINSSIGSRWRTRAPILEAGVVTQTNSMNNEQKQNTLMNTVLNLT